MTHGKRILLTLVAVAMAIAYTGPGLTQSTEDVLKSLKQCKDTYVPYWTIWRDWGDDDYCHVTAFAGDRKLRMINVLRLALPYVVDSSLRNVLLSCIQDFRQNKDDRDYDPSIPSLEEGIDHCVVAEGGQWTRYTFRSMLDRTIAAIENNGVQNLREHTGRLQQQHPSLFNVCEFRSGPRAGQRVPMPLPPGVWCWDYLWPQSFGVVVAAE